MTTTRTGNRSRERLVRRFLLLSDHGLFEQEIHLYGQRPDKDWSLTDCISFVVMRQNGLTEALTGDHHFGQAGFTALLAEAGQ